MKKTLVFVVLALLVLVGRVVGKYNGMVTKDETVKEAWAQVENQYQRRLDLIPNLVSTVKGYASHETKVFTDVIEARSKATQTNININDAQEFAKFQASQQELSSALSRLMMVVENYPDLKANQNFLELQSQLEGTENRIAVERKRFNEEVKKYNIFIRSFPNNFIAGIFGFEKAEMFEAEEWADVAPDIDFEEKKSDGEVKVDVLENDIDAVKKQIELEKLQQELDVLKTDDTKVTE